jgi:TonB-like protein
LRTIDSAQKLFLISLLLSNTGLGHHQEFSSRPFHVNLSCNCTQPAGLTEEAIKSVQQLKFQPAMKGGVPVVFWMMIEIEFNLK